MITPIEVTPVATRREEQQFLKMPWTIYREDPLWVPRLQVSQKALAGYAKHPSLQDGPRPDLPGASPGPSLRAYFRDRLYDVSTDHNKLSTKIAAQGR